MKVDLRSKFIFFQLTGDVLFAAGTVAYLGAFPEKERQKQIVNW
jgi:hypothetical protein